MCDHEGQSCYPGCICPCMNCLDPEDDEPDTSCHCGHPDCGAC